MKFLCDENFKKRLVNVLNALGHDAVRSRIGDPDEIVYARSLKESRIILTNDTDFLDTIKFPLRKTPGRVVFLVSPATFEFQRERFEAFISEILPGLTISNRLVEIFADRVDVREE